MDSSGVHGKSMPEVATPKPRRRTKLSKPEQHREQILAGLDAGQSQRQVAARLGISHSSISAWLDTLDQEKLELSRFRTSRVEALSSIQSKALKVQAKILQSLDDGNLEALTPAQKGNLLQALVVTNGNAYDKERLETGQSTHNISTISRMVDARVSNLYKSSITKEIGTSAPQEGARTEAESGAPSEMDAGQNSEAGGPGGMGEK